MIDLHVSMIQEQRRKMTDEQRKKIDNFISFLPYTEHTKVGEITQNPFFKRIKIELTEISLGWLSELIWSNPELHIQIEEIYPIEDKIEYICDNSFEEWEHRISMLDEDEEEEKCSCPNIGCKGDRNCPNFAYNSEYRDKMAKATISISYEYI